MKTLVSALLRLMVILPGLAATGALALPPRPLPAVEHVLIISVDGMRPDCALRADMPALRGLMREGAYTFWAKTTAVAVTLPSHTSMLTGVTPAKHGVVWNKPMPFREPVYPLVPTIFEMAVQAGYDTALIAGKTKFDELNKPGTISHSFLPAPKQEVTDALVADEAIKIIAAYKPALTFVHFPGPDAAGHAKGWGSPEQIAALANLDRQLARLETALDQAGIRGSTIIIVSADHGGAGLTHGADDVRSRHIPWIISGPGLRKNYDLTRDASLEVRTEDTCATACYLLGLPQKDYFDGKPVYAAFAPTK